MRKPPSKLARVHRAMWNDDGGQTSHYHPPVPPERWKQIHLGYLRGHPVDAYLYPIVFSGYTTTFPTESRAYTFIVERLRQIDNLGGHKGLKQFNFQENTRLLWEAGHDPTQLLIDEAHEIGTEFWLQLRMNDWHHWGPSIEDPDRPGLPQELNIYSSPWYEEHTEYLIGIDGVAAFQGDDPPVAMPFFQDFAHQEVRDSRLEITVEACERYDIDGYHYDFMRIPGYFRIGEERVNAHLMTELIRRTRAELDRIGAERGKHIGFAVRVPTTIEGSVGIGLDAPTWIEEGLVDIVVPSCFFCTDLSSDLSEWVEFARETPVRINAGMEEAYRAGHRSANEGSVLDYNAGGELSARLLLEEDRINAVAANHWATGVDGLYLFNWQCKTWSGDRLNLNELTDSVGLSRRNKLYGMTRRDGQYGYCDVQGAPLPFVLVAEAFQAAIRIVDDLSDVPDRIERCHLWVHLINVSVADTLEVSWNEQVLTCSNPIRHGSREAPVWFRFDLAPDQFRRGANDVGIQIVSRNLPGPVQAEAPITISDVEVEIRYLFPDGAGDAPRGYRART